MTAQNDNKIQEFQEAGAAIIGAIVSKAVLAPAPEPLQHIFSIAHDTGTQSKQTDLVQQVWAGLIDPSQLSIRVGGAEMARIMEQIRETKAKAGRDTQMLLAMLDDMQRVADEIGAANERIQEGLDALKEEYGDDYVEVIAGSILTEEEIAGCETEDDILVLMAERAFDENGELRPGFEHLDPRMIEILKEVHHRETVLMPQGEALKEKFVAEGGVMTPELDEQTREFGTVASIKARSELGGDGNEELVNAANEARADEYATDMTGGGLDMADLL